MTPTAEIWKTPDNNWVVVMRTLDKQGRRVTSFIGPYNTRELARTTQRCLRQYLRWVS